MCVTLGISSRPPLLPWPSHTRGGCEWCSAAVGLPEGWAQRNTGPSLVGAWEPVGVSHTQLVTPPGPPQLKPTSTHLRSSPSLWLWLRARQNHSLGAIAHPPRGEVSGSLRKSRTDSWHAVPPHEPLLCPDLLYLFLPLPVLAFCSALIYPA